MARRAIPPPLRTRRNSANRGRFLFCGARLNRSSRTTTAPIVPMIVKGMATRLKAAASGRAMSPSSSRTRRAAASPPTLRPARAARSSRRHVSWRASSRARATHAKRKRMRRLERIPMIPAKNWPTSGKLTRPASLLRSGAGDPTQRHPRPEGGLVAEDGEEPHDTAPMGAEWLEQPEHLLVGAAGPPGQMPGDDVLVVVVAHRHRVGVAVADGHRLSGGPLPHSRVAPQPTLRVGRWHLRQPLDPPVIGRHLSEDLGPSSLDAEWVVFPVRRFGHALGVGRQPQGPRPGRRIPESTPELAQADPRLLARHLLADDGGHEGVEYETGGTEAHAAVTPGERADHRVVGDESFRLVTEPDPSRDTLEDPVGAAPPRRRLDATVDPLQVERDGTFGGAGCAPPPVRVEPAPEGSQRPLQLQRDVDGDESLLQPPSFLSAGA